MSDDSIWLQLVDACRSNDAAALLQLLPLILQRRSSSLSRRSLSNSVGFPGGCGCGSDGGNAGADASASRNSSYFTGDGSGDGIGSHRNDNSNSSDSTNISSNNNYNSSIFLSSFGGVEDSFENDGAEFYSSAFFSTLVSCFILAIELGFTEVALILLTHEPRLAKSVDVDRSTPLLKACGSCTSAIVESSHSSSASSSSTLYVHMMTVCENLLARGADPNAINCFGQCPLDIAAFSGHVDLATMLLDAGANLNSTNLMGYSPIMVAVHFEHVELMKMLLARQANLAIFTPDGKSVLHIACESNSKKRFELFKVLLSASGGSDLLLKPLRASERKNNVKCKEKLPFVVAVENGCLSICEYIYQEMGLEMLLQTLNPTQLFYITTYASRFPELFDFVTDKLKLTVDRRDIDNSGQTPLIFFSSLNLTNVCYFLISRGADVAAADLLNGYTSLIYACKNSNFEYCRFLLSRGVSPNCYTSCIDNFSPLSMAVKVSNYKICDLLLSHGACSHLGCETGGHDQSNPHGLENTPFFRAANGYRKTHNNWMVVLIIWSVTPENEIFDTLTCLHVPKSKEFVDEDVFQIIRYARTACLSFIFESRGAVTDETSEMLLDIQAYLNDDYKK